MAVGWGHVPECGVQKAEGDQEIAALQERLRAQFQMQASAQRATEQMRMANQELRREIELRGADCQKTMASELALKVVATWCPGFGSDAS